MKHANPTAMAVIATAALVGHEAADFIPQTDRQATQKATPGHNPPPGADATYAGTWAANQTHCATYHLTLAATVGAALAATGVRVRPRRALAALVLSWTTHAVIDRRWPVAKILAAKGCPPDNQAVSMAVDQALHKGALLAAAGIAASGATCPKR